MTSNFLQPTKELLSVYRPARKALIATSPEKTEVVFFFKKKKKTIDKVQIKALLDKIFNEVSIIATDGKTENGLLYSYILYYYYLDTDGKWSDFEVINALSNLGYPLSKRTYGRRKSEAVELLASRLFDTIK